MRHTASSRFCTGYQALQEDIRSLTDKQFRLLKSNPVILPSTSQRRGKLCLHESVITTERVVPLFRTGTNWF